MIKKKMYLKETIGLYDKIDGSLISDSETMNKLLKEEKEITTKSLIYKFKNTPELLTNEEIKTLAKIKKKNLESYENYDLYSTHDKELFDKAVNELTDISFCNFCKLLKYCNAANTLQYKNNVNIVKDTDFMEILKVSRSKWFDIKKELVQYGALRKIKFDGKPLYKVNPSIVGHSMKINLITYYAFRDVLIPKFDKIKILYWDRQLLEECGQAIFDNSNKDKYFSEFIKE